MCPPCPFCAACRADSARHAAQKPGWGGYSERLAAPVAELADAPGLGPGVRKDVWVQVPPGAQHQIDAVSFFSARRWPLRLGLSLGLVVGRSMLGLPAANQFHVALPPMLVG